MPLAVPRSMGNSTGSLITWLDSVTTCLIRYHLAAEGDPVPLRQSRGVDQVAAVSWRPGWSQTSQEQHVRHLPTLRKCAHTIDGANTQGYNDNRNSSTIIDRTVSYFFLSVLFWSLPQHSVIRGGGGGGGGC